MPLPCTRIVFAAATLALAACEQPAAPTATPSDSAPAPAASAKPTEVETPTETAVPDDPAEDPRDMGWYAEDPNPDDSVLVLAGNAAPVKGTVLDSTGNTWTRGATIVISGEKIEAVFCKAGEDGAFEIQGLPVGATVSVSASTEPAGRGSVEVVGQGTPQTIVITPSCPSYRKDDCPDGLSVDANDM